MNAISVGYRFSREELSTLIQALRLDGLPGAPLVPVDPDTAQAVLERFAGEGMAMLADGTLYIDRLIDYLLRAAAQAESAVALADGSRIAVLWQAQRLLILGDFPERGECVLTPLQDTDEARSALADAACRMARPLWAANVFSTRPPAEFPADSALTGEQIALEAMALMSAQRLKTE